MKTNMNNTGKYKAVQTSIYTGKVVTRKYFDNLDKAIAFVNSNISVSGAFKWTLVFNSIKI